MSLTETFLFLRRLGIDTHQEPVVYMREDSHVVVAEGFSAQSRVQICVNSHHIIATVNIVKGDFFISSRSWAI
jgi:thymidine phosphorylase